MTDDTKPVEIDSEEMRRRFAPRIANSDNDLLGAVDGLIGRVSEVNGKGAEEVSGFVPTRHELCVLVKFWMTEVLDYDFWLFCYQQTCSQRSVAGRLGTDELLELPHRSVRIQSSRRLRKHMRKHMTNTVENTTARRGASFYTAPPATLW